MRVLAKMPKAAALALAGAALMAPAAAHAAWVKAESDRFVVYGDSDPATVGAFARKLTIYDEALRVMNAGVKARPDPQKVEVYLVRSQKDLRRIFPMASPDLAGFYATSEHGVVAVATILDKAQFGADTALFHEYAHHFMLENFPAAYPGWFTEGWAEYFSTAEIKPAGVTVGGWNQNRVEWLFGAPWLPMADVLGKPASAFSGDDEALYYAQSWDFTHYMRDTPERAAQLNQAIRAISGGAEPVHAIEVATGQSIDALTRNLKRYTRLQLVTIPAKLLNMNPAVTLSAMPASADDLIYDAARLSLSDPDGAQASKSDADLLADIRLHAAAHPDDRLADLTLARAEFIYGDVKVGEAIVTKRLVAQPNDLDFVRLAGEGQMFAGERDPAHRVERYRAARGLLGKAYELNKADFRPLYQYALSRSVEPGFPTENDINVVIQAHTLAPAVEQTSILAGQVLLRAGHRDDAMRVLSLVANNPHGGKAAAMARAIMAGKSEAETQAAGQNAKTTPATSPDDGKVKPAK